MKAWKLFDIIKNAKYKETGLKVNYCIKVDKKEGFVYLLFEKSSGNVDWKINFDFPKKPYHNQKRELLLHGGYVKAWKSANDVICKEAIEAFTAHPECTPIVAGWSYGGAMAAIAAEDINFRSGIKPALITFGAPKICGSKKTANVIKGSCSECLNYAQYNDIVTHVVPWYEDLGYVKIGKKYNPVKSLNPWHYHTQYGDESIYWL